MKLVTYEDITAEEEDKIIDLLRGGQATHTKAMIDNGKLPLNMVFTSNYHRSVLHFLVVNENNNELLQWLLENKLEQLNLNAQDSTLSTPLMIAAEMQNRTAIQLLLAYGADPNIENIVQQKLIDLVRIFDYNGKFEVKSWIKQAREGTLLKPPASQSSTLVHRHQTPQVTTSLARSRPTQLPATAPKTSSFSLWSFIERIKSPIFGKKKTSTETPYSLKDIPSESAKFKKS